MEENDTAQMREKEVRCSRKREGERNREGGMGRRMNKKINI